MKTQSNEQLVERPLSLSTLVRGLCDDGRIGEQDMSRINHSSALRVHPLVFLADQHLPDPVRQGRELDMHALLAWLGNRVSQKVFEIDPLKINVTAVADVMSRAFAERHRILAVEVNDSEVVIASAEPYVRAWEKDLRHVLRKPIRRVLADPREITRHTADFYTMATSVRGAGSADRFAGSAAELGNLEQMLELGSMKEPDANDQHIVNIVDWLLQYAFEQRASDIHVEPRREVGKVRFRIDGVLHSVYELPAQVIAAISSRIKILGRMDLAEKRRPQDGRLKTRTPAGNEVELRLSTLPTAFGEKLVMRIFDPDVLQRSFKQLGLEDADLENWNEMTTGNGIVLVTGPTGSGKTTTLYSTLRQLAQPEVNVCTIEDPIEMVEGAFNQMQVNAAIDLDFSSGVRALMRQDPDIIMIGEIRDLETANMAIQAALTGHLVLSTLHTNDSPGSLSRLLELGVPAYLVKATLRGIMSQRLVRILCPECKIEGDVDIDAWQQLTAPFEIAPPAKLALPVGCRACRDTGYVGRQGIYEVLVNSPAVQELIRPHTDTNQVREVAMSEGMATLRLSGAARIARGETTIEEVMRVAPPLDN